MLAVIPDLERDLLNTRSPVRSPGYWQVQRYGNLQRTEG